MRSDNGIHGANQPRMAKIAKESRAQRNGPRFCEAGEKMRLILAAWVAGKSE